jgi:hypothetical protein
VHEIEGILVTAMPYILYMIDTHSAVRVLHSSAHAFIEVMYFFLHVHACMVRAVQTDLVFIHGTLRKAIERMKFDQPYLSEKIHAACKVFAGYVR